VAGLSKVKKLVLLVPFFLIVAAPDKRVSPLTSNFSDGLSVPIPTLRLAVSNLAKTF